MMDTDARIGRAMANVQRSAMERDRKEIPVGHVTDNVTAETIAWKKPKSKWRIRSLVIRTRWNYFLTRIRMKWLRTEVLHGSYWEIRKKLYQYYDDPNRRYIAEQFFYHKFGRKHHQCIVYWVPENAITNWLGFPDRPSKKENSPLRKAILEQL